jgi:hypothetical protein
MENWMIRVAGGRCERRYVPAALGCAVEQHAGAGPGRPGVETGPGPSSSHQEPRDLDSLIWMEQCSGAARGCDILPRGRGIDPWSFSGRQLGDSESAQTRLRPIISNSGFCSILYHREDDVCFSSVGLPRSMTLSRP